MSCCPQQTTQPCARHGTFRKLTASFALLLSCQAVHFAYTDQMRGWFDLLLFYLTIASIFFFLWLAFWAWQRFSITTFIWIVVTRCSLAAKVLLIQHQVLKEQDFDALAQRLSAQLSISPGDLLYLSVTAKTAALMLAVVCLALLAAAELAHLGPRITHGFTAPRALVYAYKLRFLIGILALLLVLAPDLLLHFWH